MNGPSDRSWRHAVREHLQLLRADATTWFIFIASAATLTASEYHATTGEYRDHFSGYLTRAGLNFFAVW